jgi:hypothetical protein
MNAFAETRFILPAVKAACAAANLSLEKPTNRSAVLQEIAANPQAGPEEIVRNVLESRKPKPPAPERTLEDVLDKLVHRIALQPYGYCAAKFSQYPEQHTADLKMIELSKQDIWQRIAEIAQEKLGVIACLENLGK